MDRPDLEALSSANNEMKKLVDSLLDGLDQQRADLPGVCERLAESRTSAWSSDKLVEVTVDAYGIVVDVRLTAHAFQAGPPARLARSITEASRAAAEAAQHRRAEILAPITDTAGALPDLPDLFPGAPSLREVREIVGAAARTAPDVRRDRDSEQED
ncbi:YbaB/EbfC family nucleoid-associated protein [Nocardia wallacei]|uniref:YbaB/EbfC family nucleoid-associated protein n=1 Tax=Nocardia wallacei TaxID=480035 RepID=UPI0024547A4F|nr:YbaB/EbfC family nucleoid-associated protein [Nocardia wallacei]